jgi:hypothetical protein
VGIAKENAAAAAAAICDSSTIGWVSALSSAGASGSGLKPARSGFDTCKCGKKKTMSTPTAIHGHNSEKMVMNNVLHTIQMVFVLYRFYKFYI